MFFTKNTDKFFVTLKIRFNLINFFFLFIWKEKLIFIFNCVRIKIKLLMSAWLVLFQKCYLNWFCFIFYFECFNFFHHSFRNLEFIFELNFSFTFTFFICLYWWGHLFSVIIFKAYLKTIFLHFNFLIQY